MTERITPRLLAVLTFLPASCCCSRAPRRRRRDAWSGWSAWLPLGVIEVSHFTGSVVGAVLLLLSQGLARRLDAAYYLAAGAIGVGIAASLLKGLDYEEAILLAIVLVVLSGAVRRSIAAPRFSRRGSRRCGWRPCVGALGASIWLGLFAFKHVDYSQELWWQFELRGEASRFLRASVGAAVVVLLFGVARLVRPAPHDVVEPGRRGPATRPSASSRRQPRPPHLVLPARQGADLQRGPHGVHHVRRAGPDLGGAGRSGRTRRRGAAT